MTTCTMNDLAISNGNTKMLRKPFSSIGKLKEWLVNSNLKLTMAAFNLNLVNFNLYGVTTTFSILITRVMLLSIAVEQNSWVYQRMFTRGFLLAILSTQIKMHLSSIESPRKPRMSLEEMIPSLTLTSWWEERLRANRTIVFIHEDHSRFIYAHIKNQLFNI